MSSPLRYETIVVPIDFSRSSARAVELASQLAQEAGPGRLVLVHACFVPVEIEALVGSAAWGAIEDHESRAGSDLSNIARDVEKDGVAVETVIRRGNPEKVVLDVANELDADLIVMGTHGRTGLAHVMLGSVAERVVREADCPVLTTRPREGASAPAS